MGAHLWNVFSNPRSIAGPQDVPFLIIYALVVMAITVGFMAAVARHVLRRGILLNAVVGGSFVPLLMFALAGLALVTTPADDIDAHGMMALSFIVLGICAAPASFVTSAVYARWLKRRAGL